MYDVCMYIHNKGKDCEKQNKYLKLIFTLMTFQDFFSSVKFL